MSEEKINPVVKVSIQIDGHTYEATGNRDVLRESATRFVDLILVPEMKALLKAIEEFKEKADIAFERLKTEARKP